MDFMKSVNGYGKVGEIGDPAFRRKRSLIVAVSGVLLLTLIIAAIVGVVAYNHNNDDDHETSTTTSTSSSPSSPSSSSPTMLSDSIKSVCRVTRFPDSCFYQLKKGVTNCNHAAAEPEVLFKLSMEVAMNEISNLSKVPEKLISKTNDVRENSPLLDCRSLYQDAIDQLKASISCVKPGEDGSDKLPLPSKIDDIKTWLSAALTDLQTCLDGLEETDSPALEEIKKAMQNSTEFTSNSLAIISKISSLHHRRRRLLGFGFGFGF